MCSIKLPSNSCRYSTQVQSVVLSRQFSFLCSEFSWMVAAQGMLQTLHSTATNWLARQLSQLVADLNSISAKEVREFDEKLRLDNGLNWQM